MNDCVDFRYSNLYNVCRGCLKTGQDVKVVDNILAITYKNFIPDCNETMLFERDEDVCLCVYCKALLNKFTKFKSQCLNSCKYLKNILSDTSLRSRKNKFTIEDLAQNNTIVVKAETSIDNETKSLIKSELQTNALFESYFKLSKHTNASCSYSPGDLSRDDVKMEEVWDEGCNDDTMSDDIPLVRLKYEHFYTDEVPMELEVKPLENDFVVNTTGKVKKKKDRKHNKDSKKHDKRKALKAGFSSRMVQETNEYVVIKLTKEQVEEDMRQKALSDKYLNSPFKCEKCVKGFIFEDVLRKHLEKHSAKAGQYCCELCSQYCPSVVSLRGHMKSHTTRYKCKVCNEVRLSRQHLIEHHANSHTSEGMMYKCHSCEFVTDRRTSMQRHTKVKHTDLSKPAPCDKCGKIIKSENNLRLHMLQHEARPRYSCEQCGQCFMYPSQLRHHRESRHSGNSYYCVECNLSFKSRDNLKMHFKKSKAHRDPNISMPRPPVHGAVCADCGRRYSSRATLRQHSRRAHRQLQQEKKHKCHFCDQSFAQRAVLVKHIRVHTGERPYACSECGLTFTQYATRYTHMRLVHQKLPRTKKAEVAQRLNQNNTNVPMKES